jgi:hypothetical protein
MDRVKIAEGLLRMAKGLVGSKKEDVFTEQLTRTDIIKRMRKLHPDVLEDTLEVAPRQTSIRKFGSGSQTMFVCAAQTKDGRSVSMAIIANVVIDSRGNFVADCYTATEII